MEVVAALNSLPIVRLKPQEVSALLFFSSFFCLSFLTSEQILSKKKFSGFLDLDVLMSGVGNYRGYRRELESAQKVRNTRSLFQPSPPPSPSPSDSFSFQLVNMTEDLPIMPYFGVLTKDITSLEDGNLNHIGNHRLVNFSKLRMLGAFVDSVKSFQKQYSPPPDANPILYNYLLNLVVMDEDSLYKCSASFQPPTW
jgi:hypothetical protein